MRLEVSVPGAFQTLPVIAMDDKKNQNDEILSNILETEVLFYTDEVNPTHVFVEYLNTYGVPVVEPISSPFFKAFLDVRFGEETQSIMVPKVSHVLEHYSSDAIYHQKRPCAIHHRLTGSITDGRIYYAMADKLRRTIVVWPNDWDYKRPKKVKFLKSEFEKEQVEPISGSNVLQLLRPYVNLPKNEFILFAVALIQSFSRSSSHFAMIFSSEKGTGKTTLTRVVRELVDPNKSGIVLTSTSEGDLKNTLANTYLACFDNTESMSASFSNILCAAITGTQEAKRKLYSDCDQVVLSLHNFVILNGIDIVPYKSDLAERSLYLQLEKISPSKRKTDYVFWKNFQADKPRILGAIFDTLAKAMEELPQVTTTELHRMADAHLEMLAIARVLGIPESKFNQILSINKATLDRTYAANNPFVSAISDFFQMNGPISGQAAQVYQKVKAVLGSTTALPGSASAFTRKLRSEESALNNAGVAFTVFKDPGKDNRHVLAIYENGGQPSLSTKTKPHTKVKSLLDVDEE